MTDRPVTPTATDTLHRHPTAMTEHFADEVVVFLPESGSSVLLNRTAAAVWEAIDGQRSTSDIADLLAQAYGIEASHIAADVTAGVAGLVAAGVVIASG